MKKNRTDSAAADAPHQKLALKKTTLRALAWSQLDGVRGGTGDYGDGGGYGGYGQDGGYGPQNAAYNVADAGENICFGSCHQSFSCAGGMGSKIDA